jgi:hypothetical protein
MGIVNTLAFVLGKLWELFHSLVFLSSFGVFGLVIAVVIGIGVFIFFAKYVFDNWKSALGIGLGLGTVLLVLFLLSLV